MKKRVGSFFIILGIDYLCERNMNEKIEDKKELITTDATANAVQVIKAAILHSQYSEQKVLQIIIRQSELTNLQILTQNRQFILPNYLLRTKIPVVAFQR